MCSEPPRGGGEASSCASGSERSLTLRAESSPHIPASQDGGVDGKDGPRLLAAGQGPRSPVLPSGLARPHAAPQPVASKVIRAATREEVWEVWLERESQAPG